MHLHISGKMNKGRFLIELRLVPSQMSAYALVSTEDGFLESLQQTSKSISVLADPFESIFTSCFHPYSNGTISLSRRDQKTTFIQDTNGSTRWATAMFDEEGRSYPMAADLLEKLKIPKGEWGNMRCLWAAMHTVHRTVLVERLKIPRRLSAKTGYTLVPAQLPAAQFGIDWGVKRTLYVKRGMVRLVRVPGHTYGKNEYAPTEIILHSFNEGPSRMGHTIQEGGRFSKKTLEKNRELLQEAFGLTSEEYEALVESIDYKGRLALNLNTIA